MVIIPNKKIVSLIKENLNSQVLLNRSKTYTPAVTKVEECTNEDTGVGAAMAAGNQALKGI